jgi:thymidylate synthase
MINELDRQYKELLETIIHFGIEKKDRTGTGTKSVFGYTIRHNMQKGFPLLTTKKMAWKQIVSELLWFLRGDTNIEFLHKHNNHIWDGDYKKSGRTDGELGPIYGKQWRDWGGRDEVKVTNERDENGYLKFEKNHIKGIDQIENLINELTTNPDSRRLIVSAWNVSDLDKMVLPPCHYGFQCWTRELTIKERLELWDKIPNRNIMDFPTGPVTEKQYHDVLDKIGVKRRAISLMWNQRSVDTFLGLPFNIASYGLLLTMIADEVGMMPDELIGNLGDTHLYLNHIEQAKEQISRTPYELPKVFVRDGIESFMPDDIVLENYQSHPTIKAPLSN